MACKKSNASKFNRVVTLKQFTEGARDAVGGLSASSYTDVRDIWCRIKPVRGVEKLADSAIKEFVDTVFECDYLNVADLLAATDRSEWKLTYDSVDFNIRYMVDVNEAHKTVEIYARRGGAS